MALIVLSRMVFLSCRSVRLLVLFKETAQMKELLCLHVPCKSVVPNRYTEIRESLSTSGSEQGVVLWQQHFLVCTAATNFKEKKVFAFTQGQW